MKKDNSWMIFIIMGIVLAAAIIIASAIGPSNADAAVGDEYLTNLIDVDVGDGEAVYWDRNCSSGDDLRSGGYQVAVADDSGTPDEEANVEVVRNHPYYTPGTNGKVRTWRFGFVNNSGHEVDIYMYVLCVQK